MGSDTQRKVADSNKKTYLIYLLCSVIAWSNAIWFAISFALPRRYAPTEAMIIQNLQMKVSSLLASGAGNPETFNNNFHPVCDGCDPELAKKLNDRFRFSILNLDRRPDKLRCVQKQLAKFGIEASRIPGIDSMSFPVDDANLLPDSVKKFLHTVDPSKRGHVGCLYGHVNFLLSAARAEASCGGPPSLALRTLAGFSDPIYLTFRSRMKGKSAEIFFVDGSGRETSKGNIPSGGERTFSSHLMEAWRVKSNGILLMEFRIDPSELSTQYELDVLRKTAVSHIFDCQAKRARAVGEGGDGEAMELVDDRISILFEDDVILREDFGEKLLWSFDNMKGQEWDIFLLNWYCNSAHWKQCNRNSKEFSRKIAARPFTATDKALYGYTVSGAVSEFSIVPVKTFMSGSAYAVSRTGAARLLNTFPCDGSVTGESCSMSVDWHYSSYANVEKARVYGASPPFVLMPGMGSVQSLGIKKPPKSLTSNTCGIYKSDTDIGTLGRASPKGMVENRLEAWRRSNNVKFANGNEASGYTAYDISLPWKEAEKMCRKKGHKHLATIKSFGENQRVLALVTETCSHVKSTIGGWDMCSWIGLNDFQNEGHNLWASGWRGPYTNFLEGEPNNHGDEDGMALCWTFDGQWIDYSNDNSLPCFVCEG